MNTGQSTTSTAEDMQVTLVVDACLLAGKIMLENGAETHRVEDTMTRMAQSCGIHAHSFAMPTGVIFSVDETQATKLVRINDRSTDLHKVVQVNHVSRQLASRAFTIADALLQLNEIQSAKANYSVPLRILLSALTSGCFLLMYGGTWRDVAAACIAGGIGYSVLQLMKQLVNLTFFSELTAAFAVGFVVSIFVAVGVGHSLDIIIVASVMPLVPGILITNAVGDLMSGHLVSGLSKGAQACLTAFAIGAGIAAAIQVL